MAARTRWRGGVIVKEAKMWESDWQSKPKTIKNIETMGEIKWATVNKAAKESLGKTERETVWDNKKRGAWYRLTLASPLDPIPPHQPEKQSALLWSWRLWTFCQPCTFTPKKKNEMQKNSLWEKSYLWAIQLTFSYCYFPHVVVFSMWCKAEEMWRKKLLKGEVRGALQRGANERGRAWVICW